MSEFTLCEVTGVRALQGACPAHGGDNCLRQFAPIGEERDRVADAKRKAQRAEFEAGAYRRAFERVRDAAQVDPLEEETTMAEYQEWADRENR